MKTDMFCSFQLDRIQKLFRFSETRSLCDNNNNNNNNFFTLPMEPKGILVNHI